MKSFPSTTNESQLMYGSTKSQTYDRTFDTERIKALNLNSSVPVLQALIDYRNINIGNYQAYQPEYDVRIQDFIDPNNTNYEERKIYFENPLQLPSDVIALAKDYEWVYKHQVKNLASVAKSGASLKTQVINTTIVPSMFNPMYGVNAFGMSRNTPLMNDVNDTYLDNINVDDCSIRRLCTLSKNSNSILGNAKYKYADFMYCKDLGKVSNNHLITLRRFAHPVADHIGRGATPRMVNEDKYSWEGEGDVGRLVTWFDTDDNKLEDICKFSFFASWKKLDAKIEEQESKADSENTGILGMLGNSRDAVYNEAVNQGVAGKHSIWGWLGSQISPAVFQGIGSNNELLKNYDNNKVYTPKNTVQSNHMYEGVLNFNHEFTLNFSYKLRAYDNINPRSAFIDLIGNILEVTYRRGKFWGGSRKLIGPAQSRSTFDKTSLFIDNAFDKIGGMLGSLMNEGININQIIGSIGSGIGNFVEDVNKYASALASGNGTEMIKSLLDGFKNMLSKGGVVEAVKGYIKNGLGRPQLYAWQSLLSGDDVGLWHVTIGNPLNPILSIGNLILTNAQISQNGPLGIDDFPSELKVSVTLKHARPRDITDIGRMYTQGTSAIYYHFGGHKLSDFFSPVNQGNEIPATKPGEINDTPVITIKDNLGNDKTFEGDEQTQWESYQEWIKNNPQPSSLSRSEFGTLYQTQAYNKASLITETNAKGQNLEYADVDMQFGYLDPTFQNDNECMVMRKNTYSDVIFNMMVQEQA
jgi:hypothetical protein